MRKRSGNSSTTIAPAGGPSTPSSARSSWSSPPQLAVELLRLASEKIPKGGTFLDAAISFMPEGAFPELVRLALARFEADRANELAEDII